MTSGFDIKRAEHAELFWLFSSRQCLAPTHFAAAGFSKLVCADKIDFDAVATVVLSDPGMTLCLLRASSQSCIRGTRSPRSVAEALGYLDARSLRALGSTVLAMSVAGKNHHSTPLPLDRLGAAGETVGRAYHSVLGCDSALCLGPLSQVPLAFLSLVAPEYFNKAWMLARENQDSVENQFELMTGVSLYHLGAAALRAVGMPEHLSKEVERMASPDSELSKVRKAIDFLGHGTTPWPVAWPEAIDHGHVIDGCVSSLPFALAA